jgi:hypothetical protein
MMIQVLRFMKLVFSGVTASGPQDRATSDHRPIEILETWDLPSLTILRQASNTKYIIKRVRCNGPPIKVMYCLLCLSVANLNT